MTDMHATAVLLWAIIAMSLFGSCAEGELE